jgi:DNA-binding response OmpR family regulator
MKRLVLFEWDAERGAKRAEMLRKAGWTVTLESEDGRRGGGLVLNEKPDVVLFDLSRKPSHSRATAEGIRGYKAGKGIPLIFLDGSEEDKKKTAEKVKGAVFVASEMLLKRLSQFDV